MNASTSSLRHMLLDERGRQSRPAIFNQAMVHHYALWSEVTTELESHWVMAVYTRDHRLAQLPQIRKQ